MSTYDGATIKITNWDKFNPRKDVKASSWLRLSHSLFEDPEFFDFSHAEVCFWIYLLSIASKKNSADAYLSYAHAERIGRFSKQVINSALSKLVKNGNISIHEPSTLRGRDVDVTCTLRGRDVDVTHTYATDGRTDERIDVSDDTPTQVFEEIYKRYPKRKGDQRKSHGLKHCLRHFKSQDEIEKLRRAVENYARFCDSEKKTGTAYVLQFGTFVNGRWEEWAETRTVAPGIVVRRMEDLQ